MPDLAGDDCTGLITAAGRVLVLFDLPSTLTFARMPCWPPRRRRSGRDVALRIDPVKGGEGRSGIIETDKLVRRDKEEAMRDARSVSVSSYHPIGIVVAKEDCSRPTLPGRSGRSKCRRWRADTHESHPVGIEVVTRALI